jgi:hypothetical protein
MRTIYKFRSEYAVKWVLITFCLQSFMKTNSVSEYLGFQNYDYEIVNLGSTGRLFLLRIWKFHVGTSYFLMYIFICITVFFLLLPGVLLCIAPFSGEDTGIWTQSLTLARQALLQLEPLCQLWSTSLVPSCKLYMQLSRSSVFGFFSYPITSCHLHNLIYPFFPVYSCSSFDCNPFHWLLLLFFK